MAAKKQSLMDKCPELEGLIKRLMEEAKESGKVSPDTLLEMNSELNKPIESGAVGELVMTLFMEGNRYTYRLVERGDSTNKIDVQTMDQDGEAITKYSAELDENGNLTYNILDWNSIAEGYSPVADPGFTLIINMPEFSEYVRRYASGDIEGEETLGQIEHKTKDEEVIILDVIADGNNIAAKLSDEHILEIQIPIKLAVCEECGQIFVPRQKGQKYHSPECGNRARVREWRRKKADKAKEVM